VFHLLKSIESAAQEKERLSHNLMRWKGNRFSATHESGTPLGKNDQRLHTAQKAKRVPTKIDT
jgi:hypothetical protein